MSSLSSLCSLFYVWIAVWLNINRLEVHHGTTI
nr:MAG TPA: hypothetical protein [Caudoviricetes sp.]